MRMISLIIALTLVGCGKLQVGHDFAGLVDEFNAQSPVKVTNLIIEYSAPRNDSAGATCYREIGQTPTIKVDRKTWDVMSASNQRELLRHELGHCVLNREHTDTRFSEDNCPSSIMSPSPTGEWCRNAHGEHYDKELFNG